MLVPSKNHLRDGDTVAKAVGSGAARALRANRAVLLPSGQPLQVETWTTLKKNFRWAGGPVLATWPDNKTVVNVDKDHKVRALCVLPWLLSEIDIWIRSRSPIDLLGKVERSAVTTISDPVVEAALKNLTVGVNLGTGLVHPSDSFGRPGVQDSETRSPFSWNPDEIEAWALANKRTADGARQLRAVAEAVMAGRGIRGGNEQH